MKIRKRFILTLLDRSSIMVSMNRLTRQKRVQVLAALVEGNSIRSTVRMTGIAKNTVVKLLRDAGRVCSIYHNKIMVNLPCKRLQVDEIWSFCYANINIIFASAGGGYGVVVDNSTGRRTYMKMALGGIGLGLGVKDYKQVLIFKSKETLKKFIDSGWEFGGHADAAAKAGNSGGELSSEGAIGSDIEAYSMTESGLAIQATVAGSKYWKDKDLN